MCWRVESGLTENLQIETFFFPLIFLFAKKFYVQNPSIQYLNNGNLRYNIFYISDESHEIEPPDAIQFRHYGRVPCGKMLEYIFNKPQVSTARKTLHHS